jgi:GntR family transcriptional regulator, gluconate operon transcriptional repressor
MGRLEPLSSPTLAEQAGDLIRARILSGDFATGQRLNETRLAADLGISRGPIREALKHLAAEGLVREEPRRGTFVAAPTLDDVRDLYDLRVAIEARAARLVIEHHDPAALETLREALAEIHQAVTASDLAHLARSDYNFHETICRVSGNQRLLDVFVRNASVMRLLVHIEEGQYYISFEDVEHEHRELLAAIEAGDAPRTDALVVEHLEGARDRLLGYLTHIAAEAPGPQGT